MSDARPEKAQSGPWLLCFDGSASAANAIRTAADLCGRGDALVAHVWLRPSTALLRGRRVESRHPLAEAVEEFDAGAREEAEARAAEGVRVAAECGFKAEPLLLDQVHGAWRPLVELARERRARAVVVGSHGQSPIRSALLGSVSRGIADHCPSPVIVVPSADAPGR